MPKSNAEMLAKQLIKDKHPNVKGMTKDQVIEKLYELTGSVPPKKRKK